MYEEGSGSAAVWIAVERTIGIVVVGMNAEEVVKTAVGRATSEGMDRKGDKEEEACWRNDMEITACKVESRP